jgi:hypothetical protein
MAGFQVTPEAGEETRIPWLINATCAVVPIPLTMIVQSVNNQLAGLMVGRLAIISFVVIVRKKRNSRSYLTA